tara:strand:+ start:32834 stop:34486 length:1653 start_codon:yes stop_codon:yes gene_type:complete
LKKIFIFNLIIFFGCAAISPPPGGPEDKTPPQLLSSIPESGTYNLKGGFNVKLIFSERLDDNINKSSIRVLPFEKTPLQLKVNKNIIEVLFPDSLKKNQTYQLIISREILDERKNKLDKTYQLAFSTGDSISIGEISGKVFNIKNKPTFVYLFNNYESSDSIFFRKPDFYTETDDSGRYSFKFLENRNYSIIAHQGVLPPNKIDFNRSRYGLYSKSILQLGESNFLDNINLKLKNNITPFSVLSVKMQDKRIGTINFTNGFDLNNQKKNIEIKIYDSQQKNISSISNFFQDSLSNMLNFYYDKFNDEENYFFEILNLSDTTNQIIDEKLSLINKSEIDSIFPTIISLKNTNNIIFDGFYSIDYKFNQPIIINGELDSVFEIFSDSTKITDFELIYTKPNILSILNKNKIRGINNLSVKILCNQIKSIDNFSMKDSILNISYEVKNKRRLGSISGEIINSNSKNNFLVGYMVDNKKNNFMIKSDSLTNKFIIKNLNEGMWNIYAFEDIDNNSKYSYGEFFPHTPAERFINFNQLIEVRGNWENTENNILFP